MCVCVCVCVFVFVCKIVTGLMKTSSNHVINSLRVRAYNIYFYIGHYIDLHIFFVLKPGKIIMKLELPTQLHAHLCECEYAYICMYAKLLGTQPCVFVCVCTRLLLQVRTQLHNSATHSTR